MEAAAKTDPGFRAARADAPRGFEADLESGTVLSAEHQARYWWAAQAVAGRRVLDAGCGAGRGAAVLSEAGAEEVVGVDIAPDAVSAAMERYGGAASFVLGDLTALPFESHSFDVVVSFETIQEVPDPAEALAELRRVLRPDGLVLVSTIHGSGSAARTPHQRRELTSRELSEQLGRLFGHVRLVEQTDWFMSAVMEHSDTRSAGVSRALPVELRKEAGTDTELFAVGIASNSALPELSRGVAVACAPGGPQREFRRQVLLELQLERAAARERALRQERDAVAERLWQAEARNQVELLKAAADLDRARRSVVEMQASFSWRITRPLRAIKGLFRGRS